MPIPLLGAALAAVAPQLAQRGLDLLSGIFRGAAEKGAEQIAGLIKEKTGIDVSDVAENKLTEDQWVKLREFELANQEQLLQFRQQQDAHALEMERLRVQDTADARRTQVSRDANEDPFVRRFTYHYAYLITGLTFLFVFLVIIGPAFLTLPPESWRIIDTVLGFLLGVGLSAIIQFFYGSSHGSRKKDEQLNTLTQKLPAAVPGPGQEG